jgi:hypothetical protein
MVKVNEVGKSQWVRAWNVIGMVPIQMYIGKTNGDLKPWEKKFLVEGGLATGLFNLRNLIKDKISDNDVQPYPRSIGKISSVYKRDRGTKKVMNAFRLIIDVIGYGPAMISIARNNDVPQWQKAFLYSTGIMTILVNGTNFVRNLKEDPLS